MSYQKQNFSNGEILTAEKLNLMDEQIALHEQAFENIDIPDKAPNPQKIKFTGASTAEYDGSTEVTVDIPNVDVSGAVSVHNIATDAHNDIRGLINGKVNVNDIVDNLTTSDAKKPLSANQGVELKKLIDAINIDGIPNLYVWKKYNADPKDVKQTDVSSVQIAWRLTSYSTSFSIKTADGVSTDGGYISLVNETTSTITESNTDELLGKYIYSTGSMMTNDVDEGYYFIPTTATFSVDGSDGSMLYAKNIKKLSMPTCIGYVATKSFNDYVQDKQHTDGYWYQYIKQLGDSAVVDGSAVNFTETDPTVPAWAKQENPPTYTASDVGLGNVDNVKQYSASNPPPYPVTNVNGKTGDVSLTASDVGALPNTTTIPSKLSDLTADSTHRTVTDTEKSTWNAKANTSDFPTALKNPNSLTIDNVVYDGSRAVNINTSKAFYITVANNGNDDYQIDKAITEIIEAYKGGKILFAIYDNHIYQLSSYRGGQIEEAPTGAVFLEAKFDYIDTEHGEIYMEFERSVISITGDSYNGTENIVVSYEPFGYSLLTYAYDEMINSQLNDIPSNSEINSKLDGKANTGHTHTASEVGALPDNTAIPSNLSELTEDSDHRTVTDTEKSTWNAKANVSDIPDAYVHPETHDASMITGLPTSLPNPNSMTINGTSYDGSAAIDITKTVNDMIDVRNGAVSVVAYGASPSASAADNTKAFQDALAANRVVFVPGGTYKLKGTLVIRQNCCMEMAQDTILDFENTSGNCVEVRSSGTLKGNHGIINVPYAFTGHVIDANSTHETSKGVPPYIHWSPMWKHSRYIYDVCIVKANSSGLHYSTDGVCSGTGIYLSGDGDNEVRFIWGALLQGIRIGGAFTRGIHAINFDLSGKEDSAWNHDMRIEAVIHGCETGVDLTNCNDVHLAVAVQPCAAENGTVYAKWGVYLNDCRYIDMSSSVIWDWNANNSLYTPDGQYTTVAMFGNCCGLVYNDFGYYTTSTPTRNRIYTDTPSNLEKMTIMQEPITRWFKSVDGVPYFNDGIYEKQLTTQEDLDIYFNTDVVKKFKDELATAIGTDGNVYEGVGYKVGRYMSGTNNPVETASDYYVLTGFIPCKRGDVIYAHDMSFASGGNDCRLQFFGADFKPVTWTNNDGSTGVAFINQSNIVTNGNISVASCTTADNGFTITVSDNFRHDTTAYVRFTIHKTLWGNNPMVSVNEEIKYTVEGFLADGVKVKAENVIGLSDGDSGESTPIVTNAVQYVEQTLTPEQQAQARKNIGIDDIQTGITELQPLTINGVTYDGSEAVDILLEGVEINEATSLGQTPITLTQSSDIKLVGEGEHTYTAKGITIADSSTLMRTENLVSIAEKEGYFEITATGGSAYTDAYAMMEVSGLTANTSYTLYVKSPGGASIANKVGGSYFVIRTTSGEQLVAQACDKNQLFNIEFTPDSSSVVIYWYAVNSYYWNNSCRTARIEYFYINKTSDGNQRTGIYDDSGTFTDSCLLIQVPSGVTITSDPSCEAYSIVSEEKSDSVSAPLSGKTVVCFGDSMFGNDTSSTSAPAFVAKKTGATVYNVGFGGCRMSEHPYESHNPFSMYALADAIVNDDWSLQDANAASGSANFPDQLALLKGIDFNTVDYIVIHYGANDFTAGEGVAIDDDSNPKATNTFCGAFRYSIETLLTAFPKLNIFVSLPTFRYWEADGTITYSDTWKNTNDKTLSEFIDALAKTAKEYNLPVIDCHYGLGINKINAFTFLKEDGAHHNLEGRKRFGEYIGAKLISNG